MALKEFSDDEFEFMRDWIKQSIERGSFSIKIGTTESALVGLLAAMCENYENRLSELERMCRGRCK